jgi:hypothetical protein
VTEAPRRARGEQRNAEIRARMAPLAAGERPRAVTIAALVAAALGAANLVALIAGARVSDSRPSVVATVVFCALAAVAAVGLWQVRYWAVVGFEIVLGFAVVFFSLFLLLASDVLALAICMAVVGFGGWLFWALVRPMARVQLRDRAVK